MTDDRIALCTLLEKSADADLLREMIGFAAERLMELEVQTLTGAAYMASARRTGWRSAMGGIASGFGRPAPGRSSWTFPSSGRAAIPELPRAAPGRGEGLDGDDPGGLTYRASRPAQSTTWSRRWAWPSSPKARSAAVRRDQRARAHLPRAAGRGRLGPISGSTPPTSRCARPGASSRSRRP
jgi:hypothetical protein